MLPFTTCFILVLVTLSESRPTDDYKVAEIKEDGSVKRKIPLQPEPSVQLKESEANSAPEASVPASVQESQPEGNVPNKIKSTTEAATEPPTIKPPIDEAPAPVKPVAPAAIASLAGSGK